MTNGQANVNWSAEVWGSLSKGRRSVVRTTLFALAIGDKDGWEAWRAVVCARLTLNERVLLGWYALTAMDGDTAVRLVDAALPHLQPPPTEALGLPLPPLVSEGLLDDARWWAARAPAEEIRAYALACFERMSPSDRAQFAEFVRSPVAV